MSQENSTIKNAEYTILLCDDDEFISSMYAHKFKQEGYNVIMVNSGDKVIPTLKEHKVDVVILDLILPIMTGFEVLLKLQKDDHTELRKIPIVAVSNLGQQSDIDTAKKLGAVDFVVKSRVTPKELLERIQALLPPSVPQKSA